MKRATATNGAGGNSPGCARRGDGKQRKTSPVPFATLTAPSVVLEWYQDGHSMEEGAGRKEEDNAWALQHP